MIKNEIEFLPYINTNSLFPQTEKQAVWNKKVKENEVLLDLSTIFVIIKNDVFFIAEEVDKR